MRRLWIALLALALLGGAGAATGLVWLRRNLQPARAEAPEEDFVVARGASVKSVAAALERRGLIRDARAFELLARWRGLESHLHVGEFALSASLPPDRILTMLAEGRVKTYEVVLPEGLRATEIAGRLA
ncbi:MAG TPA: endolytic transglycosylase MltG, partial [Myxococcota bacterium]|nr:endolytic transglycosylase MltG [Myxococcota bacterium]